jgi:hypothetical protein
MNCDNRSFAVPSINGAEKERAQLIGTDRVRNEALLEASLSLRLDAKVLTDSFERLQLAGGRIDGSEVHQVYKNQRTTAPAERGAKPHRREGTVIDLWNVCKDVPNINVPKRSLTAEQLAKRKADIAECTAKFVNGKVAQQKARIEEGAAEELNNVRSALGLPMPVPVPVDVDDQVDPGRDRKRSAAASSTGKGKRSKASKGSLASTPSANAANAPATSKETRWSKMYALIVEGLNVWKRADLLGPVVEAAAKAIEVHVPGSAPFEIGGALRKELLAALQVQRNVPGNPPAIAARHDGGLRRVLVFLKSGRQRVETAAVVDDSRAQRRAANARSKRERRDRRCAPSVRAVDGAARRRRAVGGCVVCYQWLVPSDLRRDLQFRLWTVDDDRRRRRGAVVDLDERARVDAAGL